MSVDEPALTAEPPAAQDQEIGKSMKELSPLSDEMLMGMSPKFGALVGTIPGPVLGGLSVVLFGLIAATGGRIWVQNRVDFSNSRNLVTAAVTLTIGAGDLVLKLGGFSVGGIGTATFGAIILYQLLREPADRHDALATADSGVDLETVQPAASH
jgi:putative pyrimidine permease RutG